VRSLSIILSILFALALTVPGGGLRPATAHTADQRIKLESDGWEIFGDLRIPRSEKQVAAVILLHKAAGDRSEYEELADQLEKKGIASLRIDLRGHGESANKGKFGPPFGEDPKMRALLDGTENDITAAFNYLTAHPGIDGDRIGFVGASYSGERMAKSARRGKYGKAYVALSPGDFSDESIEAIDKSKIPWFFIRSVDERDFFNELFAAIRRKSRSAQIMELPGADHATRILTRHQEMSEIIAVWFKHNL
jgi:dienelactone hydrolase